MYLNGDYKNLNQKAESHENTMDDIHDLSYGDPDQMMKQSQDVDEWLLSGLSENGAASNRAA